MRPVLFVACFSTGLTLMLYSSVNQPRTAEATFDWGSTSEAEVISPDDLRTSWPRAQRVTPAPDLTSRPPVSAATAIAEAADPTPVPDPDPPAEDASQPTDSDSLSDIEPVDDDPTEVDEPEPADDPGSPDEDAEPLNVELGDDIVVWGGVGEVNLAARGARGDGVTYVWEQTGGPRVRLDDDGATAVVRDLGAAPSWSDVAREFSVKATDVSGAMIEDRVTVITSWSPGLEIIPSEDSNSWNDRYFKEVDGASLAYYESWILADPGGVAGFVLDSPVALDIQRLEDDQFEMNYSGENGRHLYQFQVYQPAERSQARLLLFVETAEGIPAVVQLGVEW